jgi:hypothetical protein
VAKLTWLESGKKVTPKKIKAFEEKYGITLPPSYSAFLVEQNGGRPRPAGFRWRRQDGAMIPEGIGHLSGLSALNEAAERASQELRSSRPSKDTEHIDYLPIGYMQHGTLCIRIAPPDAGAIYISTDLGVRPSAHHQRAFDSIDALLAGLDPVVTEWSLSNRPQRTEWPGKRNEERPPHRRDDEAPRFEMPKRGPTRLTPWGQFFDSGPEITSRKASAAARRLGCTLPKAYRDFLAISNGGQPRRNEYVIDDDHGSIVSEVFYLYGVDADRPYRDLESWDAALRRRLPPGWLAIGCTAWEDQIVICVEGERAGEVCEWDAFAGERQPLFSLTSIAPGLESFLEQLRLPSGVKDVADPPKKQKLTPSKGGYLESLWALNPRIRGAGTPRRFRRPPIIWEVLAAPVTMDDVQAFNRAFSMELHPDHAALLCRRNGGYPLRQCFRWKRVDGEIVLSTFDSITPLGLPPESTERHPTIQFHVTHFPHLMCDGYVPLGSADQDSELFVKLTKPQRGAVYIADDAIHAPEVLCQFVAKSIPAFFAMLIDDPGDEAWQANPPDLDYDDVLEGIPPKKRTEPMLPRRSGGREVKTPWGRFVDVGPDVTVQKIAGAGVGGTPDYREFIKVCNGGRPVDRRYFSVPGAPPHRCLAEVHYLYGIDAEAEYRDVKSWNRALRRLLPYDWLAIGRTTDGDQIVLRTDMFSMGFGRICLWDAKSRSRMGSEVMTDLALSFDAFMAMLRTGKSVAPP